MTINDVQVNADLETVIGELREQLNLHDIQLLQKPPRRSGDHLQVQCPYHGDGQEHKPSAGIRDRDGLFHCFACGAVKGLPELISNCFNYNDGGMWGWQWIIKNFGTVAREERKDIKLDMMRKGRINAIKPAFVTEEELQNYRYIHPYMYERKLTDDIIELFDIGYDRAAKAITFPIKDISGNTLFVARRSVHTKFFSYPRGAVKPLYGLYELSKSMPSNDYLAGNFDVIVCESMLDALTVWVYGKYAVALNGLGNDMQFRQLHDLPCRKLILATDMDDRGLRARERIKRNVPDKIIMQYFLPDGKKDLNELEKEEFDALEEKF